VVIVSAVSGEGLDRLREALDRLAFGQPSPAAALALTSRHGLAIDAARAAIARAGEQRELEVLALELREALDALGQILGVMAPDDLLGRIFSAFCIGK
jgi:tRNA modification GTPase